MAKHIIKNALMVIPTMLCVVFIIFTINHLTPGDPVAVFYDFDYTEEQYAEKAAEWGLDQPFFQQFVNYIKNIVTKLDFGYSYYSGKSVMSELTTRFPVSLKLGLISVALTVLIGVPFGIISATRQYSALDYGVTFISLFFAAVPGFWLSMIMHSHLLQPVGLAALLGPDQLDVLHYAGHRQLGPIYRLHYPADPFQHAGGHPPGLHPHRPGQRRQRGGGYPEARPAQRPHSRGHPDRHAGRCGHCRLRHY